MRSSYILSFKIFNGHKRETIGCPVDGLLIFLPFLYADLQVAAELGRTLLERNEELENDVKSQQAIIDDQAQEIEVKCFTSFFVFFHSS